MFSTNICDFGNLLKLNTKTVYIALKELNQH